MEAIIEFFHPPSRQSRPSSGLAVYITTNVLRWMVIVKQTLSSRLAIANAHRRINDAISFCLIFQTYLHYNALMSVSEVACFVYERFVQPYIVRRVVRVPINVNLYCVAQ